MRYYMIILMMVLTFACSKNRVPKGILTDKQITPVLVDIHLAEAIFAQRYTSEPTKENNQEDLYLSVLRKHKINQKDFEKSVLYYGKHPDKYRPIYDEVLNRLSEMSAMSRAKDSIQAKNMKSAPVKKDTLQIKKLEAETRAKDSVLSIKLNAKPGNKDIVKIPKTSVKSGKADSVRINKMRVKPINKDTVQLQK